MIRVRRFFTLVLLLALAAGVAGWLATRPVAAAGIQPSQAAVVAAEAKIAVGFGGAGVRAVLTQQPQTAHVQLTDVELTSLVASRLSSTAKVRNVSVRGTSDGVFDANGETDVQGVTLDLDATGLVTVDGGGAIHLDVHQASVGLLPLPSSTIQSLAEQSASSLQLPVPPHISDLSVQPIAGGAIVSGTASP